MGQKSLVDRILAWPEDESTQCVVYGTLLVAMLFAALWVVLVLPNQMVANAGLAPYIGGGAVVDVARPGDSHYADVALKADDGKVYVYYMDRPGYFEMGAPVAGTACKLEFVPWWTPGAGFFYVPHLVTCAQDA